MSRRSLWYTRWMNERPRFAPGHIVHEIPPGPDNPRNSEGSFLTLRDGTILFAYSRFRGNEARDDAPSDIAGCVSADGGATWHTSGMLVSAAEHGTDNLMSVTLMRMHDGSVGLFYLVRASGNDLRYYYRRSFDEGKSWGTAQCCTEPPGYYVVNNDRTVRLSDRRLVVPAAFHRNGLKRSAVGARNSELRFRFDPRATSLFFLSDDDGETWRESRSTCSLPFGRNSRSGLQEPGVIELADAVLWAWARTDLGVQYEMFSVNGGETWTPPEPSRFTAPQSPLSAKRVPGSGCIVAVWNPIPNYNGRSQHASGVWTGGRTPLVLASSCDEARSWSDPVTIEEDGGRGFCYVAMHFTENALLLAYCAGGAEDGGCLNRLRLRSVPLE